MECTRAEGEQLQLNFTGCTEFHQQIQPMLPKQLNSWHGNIIFQSKRQPRLGLLCQLCVKSARKQGHMGMINYANPCPQNFQQRNKHQRFTLWWKKEIWGSFNDQLAHLQFIECWLGVYIVSVYCSVVYVYCSVYIGTLLNTVYHTVTPLIPSASGVPLFRQRGQRVRVESRGGGGRRVHPGHPQARGGCPAQQRVGVSNARCFHEWQAAKFYASVE